MGTKNGYSDKMLQTERLLDHGGYDDKELLWSVDIKLNLLESDSVKWKKKKLETAAGNTENAYEAVSSKAKENRRLLSLKMLWKHVAYYLEQFQVCIFVRVCINTMSPMYDIFAHLIVQCTVVAQAGTFLSV